MGKAVETRLFNAGIEEVVEMQSDIAGNLPLGDTATLHEFVYVGKNIFASENYPILHRSPGNASCVLR